MIALQIGFWQGIVVGVVIVIFFVFARIMRDKR